MRIINLIFYDIKFQIKYGFYLAYLVVGIFYIAILRFLPETFKALAGQFIIYTDTAILGFLFIGGIILLEKSQRTLESLFVSPIKISEYIISKIASLTLMALIVSLLIIFFGYGFNIDYFSLTTGIVFSSVAIIQLGIIIGAHSKTINHYLINFTLTTPLFIVPLLDMFNLLEHPLAYILPTQCTFKLIESAFSYALSTSQLVMISLYLIITTVILYKFTYSQFYKNIVLKVGDN